MRIRVKERVTEEVKRIDSTSKVDNVELAPDLVEEKNSLISFYFRGKSSSGILDFTLEEAKELSINLQKLLKITKKK